MKTFELNIDQDSAELSGLTISEAFARIEQGQALDGVVKPISITLVKAAELGLKLV